MTAPGSQQLIGLSKADASALAADLAKRLASGLWPIVLGYVGKLVAGYRASTRSTFERYIADTADRCMHIKSLILRDRPGYIYSYYVPLSVRLGDTTINRAAFRDVAHRNRLAIISGLAGSGKTTVMRHFYLGALEAADRIPLFVELRDLNDFDGSLSDFIASRMLNTDPRIDKRVVEAGFRAGRFTVFADGYDEVSFDRRTSLRTELHSLARMHDDNHCVVSSRPDSEFTGWSGFSQFRVERLSLDDARTLVELLPFEEVTRTRFSNDLKDGLYRKHESFLSNPLLLTIMLLTYSEYAEIPDRLSTFYDQAFDVLFQRHDATKSGYVRRKESGLDARDFAKVFGAFCLQTYEERMYRFPRPSAVKIAQKAATYAACGVDAEAFLRDAQQAACLLIEDGLQLTFAHRSFQEYFAARFISEFGGEAKSRLIERYLSRFEEDDVIDLLLEMDAASVEEFAFLPYLDRLFEEIGVTRSVGPSHYLRYISSRYDHLLIRVPIDKYEQCLAFDDEGTYTHNGDNSVLETHLSSKKFKEQFSEDADIALVSYGATTEIERAILRRYGPDVDWPPGNPTFWEQEREDPSEDDENQIVYQIPIDRLEKFPRCFALLAQQSGFLGTGVIRGLKDVRMLLKSRVGQRGKALEALFRKPQE